MMGERPHGSATDTEETAQSGDHGAQRSEQIEASIAQALTELSSDEQAQEGAAPLEARPAIDTSSPVNEPRPRRRRRRAHDTTARAIMVGLIGAAVLSVALLAYAYSRGLIP